jgi:short subunit dehydrogenase-like uncharacterized protein
MGLMPEHDDATGTWTAPFIMATINTKNVHRTNMLLGHPYGADFKYDEMVMTTPGEAGKAIADAMAKALKAPFGEKPPAPGEGPSAEERAAGCYDILYIGEFEDGSSVHASVGGDLDPGYGSTSRMIAEAARTLLEHEGPGGVTTPGAAMAAPLVQRLVDHAGLWFKVE